MKTKDSVVFALGGMCVAMLTLAAPAAPYLPTRPKVPDEIRCLKSMRSIQLIVETIPEGLAEHGLRMTDVQDLAGKLFKTEGFNLVNDHTAPIFNVSFRVMRDDSVPNVVGFMTFIEVKQTVRVVRLDEEEMMLPTATLLAYSLKRDHEVAEAALDSLALTIRKLVGFVSVAAGKEMDE